MTDKRKPIWRVDSTRRNHEEGTLVCPKWMGYSHYSFDLDVKHYYLLPFNWIVRWTKQFWYHLRWHHAAEGWDGRIERINVRREGFDEGYAQGLGVAERLYKKSLGINEAETP